MKKYIVGVLAIVGMVAVCQAQSPRRVLVQDMTGWDCQPCAVYMSNFSSFVVRPEYASKIAILSYHCDWIPYMDSMGFTNPASTYWFRHDAIEFIPQYFFNGRNVSLAYVSNAKAFNTILDSLQSTMSPITMKLEMTRSQGRLHVHQVISSTEAMKGMRMHTEIAEMAHHYTKAGTNGEHDFYWIDRAALPDTNGVTLDLEAGVAKTFDFDYVVPGIMTDSLLYPVAFVQDEATHEILQSASIEPWSLVVVPHPTMLPLDGTGVASVTITNPNSTDVVASIVADTASPNYDKNWSMDSPAPKAIAAGATTNFEFLVHGPAVPRSGIIPLRMFTSNADMPSITQKDELSVCTKSDAAIIECRQGAGVYDTALSSLILKTVRSVPAIANAPSFVFVENDVRPNIPFPPEDYTLSIIDLASGNWPSINWKLSLDSVTVRAMQLGKRVLVLGPLSSSNYWQLGLEDTMLFTQTFTSIQGVIDDPITDKLALTPGPSPVQSWYFGQFSLSQGSKLIPILYDNFMPGSRIFCGFRYESPSGGRLVCITPPIQNLRGGDTLLARSIAWLLADQKSAVPVKAPGANSISIYPNPARDLVTISMPGMRNIRIHNLLGVEIEAQTSITEWTWNCKSREGRPVQSGVYFADIEDPATGKILMRPFMVTH